MKTVRKFSFMVFLLAAAYVSQEHLKAGICDQHPEATACYEEYGVPIEDCDEEEMFCSEFCDEDEYHFGCVVQGGSGNLFCYCTNPETSCSEAFEYCYIDQPCCEGLWCNYSWNECWFPI